MKGVGRAIDTLEGGKTELQGLKLVHLLEEIYDLMS